MSNGRCSCQLVNIAVVWFCFVFRQTPEGTSARSQGLGKWLMCFKKQNLEKHLGCHQWCHNMGSYLFGEEESITAQQGLVKGSRAKAAVKFVETCWAWAFIGGSWNSNQITPSYSSFLKCALQWGFLFHMNGVGFPLHRRAGGGESFATGPAAASGIQGDVFQPPRGAWFLSEGMELCLHRALPCLQAFLLAISLPKRAFSIALVVRACHKDEEH